MSSMFKARSGLNSTTLLSNAPTVDVNSMSQTTVTHISDRKMLPNGVMPMASNGLTNHVMLDNQGYPPPGYPPIGYPPTGGYGRYNKTSKEDIFDQIQRIVYGGGSTKKPEASVQSSQSAVGSIAESTKPYGDNTPYGIAVSLKSLSDCEAELRNLRELVDAGFIQMIEYEQRKRDLEHLKKFSKDISVKHIDNSKYNSTMSETMGSKKNGATNRVMRLFVSSTFVDMKEEREYLIKNVFPQLSKLCKERGVNFSAVDLRWGITTDQTSEGNTINICLGEVDKCRPYFLCMLGSRYGWSQSFNDGGKPQDELLKRTFEKAAPNFPFIRSHLDKSVTELEVRHAVLNDSETQTARNALFFFKNVAVDDDSRLTKLKKDIYDRPGLHRFKYDYAKELGDAVLKEYTRLIDQDFPLEDSPTPLAKERLAHSAFQESRCKTYIARSDYFEFINSHIVIPGATPIVVVGGSGAGKSAFVCNWTDRYQAYHPDKLVIAHYIGSTSQSSQLAHMLNRIMNEICAHYELTELAKAIPSDLNQMIQKFPSYLVEASNKGGLTLVLDALNQLSPEGDSHQLLWLPTNFPTNVKLMVSTLDGTALNVLNTRKWKQLSIAPLDEAEKLNFVHEYMKQCGKTFKSEHAEMIAQVPQTSNALYLKTLLDELRVFGSFEELDATLHHYLQASGPVALFQLILARIDKDFSKPRPKIVQDILTAIHASRRGLTETEIMEMMQIGQSEWSPLCLALDEMLVNRSGFLTFFHDYLRQTVSSLDPQGSLIYAARKRLCDYFGRDMQSPRFYEEVPFQYVANQDASALQQLLQDATHFANLYHGFKFDLFAFWRFPDAKKVMANALLASIKSGVSQAKSEAAKSASLYVVDSATSFFKELNLLEEAHAFARYALQVSTQLTPQDLLGHAEREEQLAYVLRLQGRYPEAEMTYKAVLEAKKALLPAVSGKMANTFNQVAVLYRKMGKYQEAETLYANALDIRRQLYGEVHVDVAQSMNSFGCLHQDMGRLEEAEKCFNEAIRQRELLLGASHPDLAMSLYNKGNLYLDWSKYKESEQYYNKALKIYVEVFGYNNGDVANTLSSLAGVIQEQGRYEDAEKLYFAAITLKEAIFGAEHPELALTLNDYAVLLSRQGEHYQALEYYQRVAAIRSKLVGENHPDFGVANQNIGTVYQALQQYTTALSYYQRNLQIQTGSFGESHPAVASATSNVASIFQLLGQTAECEAMYLKAIAIYQDIAKGQPDSDLALTMNDLAVFYNKNNMWEKAEATYLKSLDMFERVYESTAHPDVGRVMVNIGHFYMPKDPAKGQRYVEQGQAILKTALGK